MDQEYITCLLHAKTNFCFLSYTLLPRSHSLGNQVWDSLINQWSYANVKNKLAAALNLHHAFQTSARLSRTELFNPCTVLIPPTSVNFDVDNDWAAPFGITFLIKISSDGEGGHACKDRYSHGHIHRQPQVSSILTAGRLLWHTGFGILSQLIWWLSRTV